MQRLDQVLRELQPVLKTLNDKSNALVFEAKDKKIHSRRERNNEKWLLAAAVCVLTACSSGGESKTYYQLPVAGRRAERRSGARLLWVEQVSIPDYLAVTGGLSDHRRSM